MIPLEALRTLSHEVGFDAVGASAARPADGVETNYRRWIDLGFHGEMEYLARNMEKRMDPTLLVPGARSIVSTLLSYNIALTSEVASPPRVARYAWLRDYHAIIKEKLFALLNRLREQFGEINGRAFVDSAPFLDRYWAIRSGLGWIGKHSLLIHPRLGSFLFIGSLVIDAEIETSEGAMPPRCGKCNACIEACPAGALLAPGLMNATKCIAYLTIEKRGELTPAERTTIAPWAFGCDACQEACPWNKRAAASRLQDEIIVTRPLLNEFSRGKAPLPAESPLLRADADRLRILLSGKR